MGVFFFTFLNLNFLPRGEEQDVRQNKINKSLFCSTLYLYKGVLFPFKKRKSTFLERENKMKSDLTVIWFNLVYSYYLYSCGQVGVEEKMIDISQFLSLVIQNQFTNANYQFSKSCFTFDN